MDRPEVVVLNSASVDGKIAISPTNLLLYGDERWKAIEGSGGSNLFEWLKTFHKPQATLEGSGSFVLEGEVPDVLPPYLGDKRALYQDYLPEAILEKDDLLGWFTVVDGRGRVRWTYTHEFPDEAWKGWFLLVLVCKQTPPAYLAYLQRETVPYLVSGKQRVDLGLALQKMKTQLDVNRVISTAGGKLNGVLLRAGLVDEVNLEFLPAIIGGTDTPSLFTSSGLKPDEWPVKLSLISAQVQEDGRVWLHYRVLRE